MCPDGETAATPVMKYTRSSYTSANHVIHGGVATLASGTDWAASVVLL